MQPDLASRVAIAVERTRRIGARIAHETIGAAVSRACAANGPLIACEVFEYGDRITFADFEIQSHRYARALIALGIEPGDRVAVMLPNRLAYPLLFVAMARIGAVHVPLNTRYTAPEIAHVLKDSGARMLIHDATFATVLAELPDWAQAQTTLTECATFEQCAADQPAAPVQTATVTPESLATIQYTSGTTGLPKGCMLSHDYWLVLAHAAIAWDARPARRLLSAQPYFYMDPQWITLKALLSAATLVLAPGLSASRFGGWISEHHINWCIFPVLMARQLPVAGEADTSLEQVATFGWPPDTARDFRTRFGAMAREGFGMTEIGMGSWMPPEFDQMYDSGSTGIAAPCREVSIRDATGQEVATGDTGELWVRGRAIFQGYWNRPKANARALDGTGWFRTGDLFCADGSGFLFLVGRIKDMIRRSQENISAREVELAICSLDGIEDAAAVAVADPVRTQEVKLYVKLSPGFTQATLTPAIIMAHAATCLAAFKRPRYLAYCDTFPRTASNKIAKDKLLARSGDLRVGTWDYAEGRWR